MANTTKRTNTTRTTQKDAIVENPSAVGANELETLRSENQDLRSKFEEMTAKMEQMAQMMQNMNMMGQFMQPHVDSAPKDIEVISLVSGTLVLTTTGRSDGRHYEFNNQFDSVLIPESDLKLIIKAMPNTTQGGKYFINDVEFVNKNGLSAIYRTILTQQKIEEFFTKPYTEAMEIYHNANSTQKSIIESMIVDKRLNNEFVDANVLMMISNESGKDFMNIEPLLKEE